jgi:two-component system osmolarity sensor histidine kinase EnvZ
MAADLAQAERDRAVLLAGISHDLRTPLTRMRLEVEVSDLPPEARANIVADLEQVDQIVAQFLDYARTEPARPKTDVDLSALVEQAIDASRLAGDESVHIERRIEAGLHIEGLAVELTRSLANLLTNAERYGRDPHSGRLDLTVVVRGSDDAAVVEIADRGPGIEASKVDELLRPFVRGDAARGGVMGAGLGLAIVERVARLHGGSLALAGNAPAGLRVTLRLPRHKARR